MKLRSILLLVGLAATANAFCSTGLPEVVNASACDSGNCGAADVFGGSMPITWPRVSNNRVMIRYCFYDQDTDRRTRQLVWNAMNAWMGALGKRNKENGHAIEFYEERDKNNKPYHCADETNPNAPWNYHVPTGTLSIFWRGEDGKNPHPEPYSHATIGYKSNPRPFDELQLVIGTDHPPWTITHEVGVIGLLSLAIPLIRSS